MAWAALISWFITAGGGFVLLGLWLRHGAEPQVHAHVVVARFDGSAYGGHLLEAHVRPTLEVVLVETPAHLPRELDEETGLPLIRL